VESTVHGEGEQFVISKTWRKDAWGIVRNPENVLENLKSHATTPDYQYKRLYRNLYNPSLYLMSYQRTYSKPGNMSKGIDGQTFDGMSEKRIQNIIGCLKDH